MFCEIFFFCRMSFNSCKSYVVAVLLLCFGDVCGDFLSLSKVEIHKCKLFNSYIKLVRCACSASRHESVSGMHYCRVRIFAMSP